MDRILLSVYQRDNLLESIFVATTALMFCWRLSCITLVRFIDVGSLITKRFSHVAPVLVYLIDSCSIRCRRHCCLSQSERVIVALNMPAVIIKFSYIVLQVYVVFLTFG